MKKMFVLAAVAALASTSAMAGDMTSLKSSLDGWAGTVEGGLNLRNGNTNSKDVYAKGAVSRAYGVWKHTLNGEALNQETAHIRSAEKYAAGWESDYQINDRLFAFGDLDWTKDRFSGYKYRTSEVLGLGYNIIKQDNFIWDARIGGGLEQTKTELGDTSNEALLKLGTNAEYKFNENVSLTELAEATFTSELETYKSETAIKSKVAANLAVRAGYNIEYLSDVPAGFTKSNSYTFVGAAYDF